MTEADRQRFYKTLTQATGIERIINFDLEREADQRATEAAVATGWDFIKDAPVGAPGGPIAHPSQAERQARLGWEPKKETVELATWFYLVADWVQFAIHGTVGSATDGLWGSPDHNAVLSNPAWTHIGLGDHHAFKPGDDPANPILERHWVVLWLSKGAPAPASEQTFTDVPPTHLFYHDIEAMAAKGVARGFPDGTFRPNDPVSRGQLMAFLNRLSK